MEYEKIKEKEGTLIAINQALIDCLKGEITGGDFLDILNDLHPIASDGDLADVVEQSEQLKCFLEDSEQGERCKDCKDYKGVSN